jgi:hypothetical protein
MVQDVSCFETRNDIAMQLKPHDTAVALKYGCLAIQEKKRGFGERASVRFLADSLGLSPGEISKSNRRLVKAKLIAPGMDSNEFNTVTRSMREWLCFGIQYSVLVETQGLGNGLVTSWSNPSIKSELIPREVPYVWIFPGGDSYGEGVSPLYPNAPVAAYGDENMHHVLSLIDAIRLGKPRELDIARKLIEKFLDEITDAQRLH